MKKLKRLLTAVCSLALVVALAVGNMGLVAYAVTGGGEDNADFKLDTDIVTSVAYGEQFDVANRRPALPLPSPTPAAKK